MGGLDGFVTVRDARRGDEGDAVLQIFFGEFLQEGRVDIFAGLRVIIPCDDADALLCHGFNSGLTGDAEA
jgi:hypothetical protein